MKDITVQLIFMFTPPKRKFGPQISNMREEKSEKFL